MEHMRLIKALRGKPTDRPPAWFMRQAGRYLPEYQKLRKMEPDFIKRCKNPELAAEITLQPIERYPAIDAAIIFSDILTIPEAMPTGLRFENGIGPVFAHPIRTLGDVQAKVSTKAVDDLHYVGEAIAKVRNELSPEKALIGFSGSPWTLATYMVEGRLTKSFEHIKRLRYQEPNTLHALLDTLTECVIAYGKMQMNAGCNAFMLFDSWGGILGFDDYPLFSLNSLTRITTELKTAHPDIPIILYTKHGMPWLSKMASSGVDGIGLDWTVDLKQARACVGDDITLQGNLDPTLLFGSPKIIEEATLQWCQSVDKQPRHILNLGHGLLPPTPPENLAHLLDVFCGYYA